MIVLNRKEFGDSVFMKSQPGHRHIAEGRITGVIEFEDGPIWLDVTCPCGKYILYLGGQ